jgi:acetyl esterase/lipase
MAQGQRYRDIIFHELKADSIVYITHGLKPLKMDVYQPVGDTAALRPLVILAHGGSFMHGDRRSERIPMICRELAMRGFVAVSIDYRLTNLAGMASKRSAYRNMIKATADGRSTVRWFTADAAKGNTFRIDRKKIFFGGTSAGAILAEQLAFIDSAGECRGMLCRAVKKFMPDSEALAPHAVRGYISLAGAVLDTNLIGPGQAPLLHIHGDADHIVPFGNKRAVEGLAPFRLAGLGASRPRYVSQRMDYTEYVFANYGHTPWDYDPGALKIVIAQMLDFLNREMK